MINNKSDIYVYPCLSDIDLGYVRISGNGLANCMITAARAYIMAYNNGYNFIDPTWFKLSIGTYLRHEIDKRHYLGLFNNYGINGLTKLRLIYLQKNKILKIIYNNNESFNDLIDNYNIVMEYYNKIIKTKIIKRVMADHSLENSIAIHVRLGDFPYKISIEWYRNLIIDIKAKTKKNIYFKIFSDGTDSELESLLKIENVKRVFYGNALADIIAISRCKMLIASMSTFSALSAFIGQKFVIFNNLSFGNVLINRENMLYIDNDKQIPNEFINRALL